MAIMDNVDREIYRALLENLDTFDEISKVSMAIRDQLACANIVVKRDEIL